MPPTESSANVLFIIFCNRFVDINKLKIPPTKAACLKKFLSLLHYLYLRVLSGLLIHPYSVFTPQSHYELLGTSRSSLFSLRSLLFFSCVSWQQLKDALMSFKSIVVVGPRCFKERGRERGQSGVRAEPELSSNQIKFQYIA